LALIVCKLAILYNKPIFKETLFVSEVLLLYMRPNFNSKD